MTDGDHRWTCADDPCLRHYASAHLPPKYAETKGLDKPAGGGIMGHMLITQSKVNPATTIAAQRATLSQKTRLKQKMWDIRGREREDIFEKTMLTKGIILEKHTHTFCFPSFNYTPDFYYPKTDTHYEVIGTRERLRQLRPILDLLYLLHGNIKLIVVRPDGTPVSLRKHARNNKNPKVTYHDLGIVR